MKGLNGDLYTLSSHRLSWAALRIAMILTALRMMDSGQIQIEQNAPTPTLIQRSPSSSPSQLTTTTSSMCLTMVITKTSKSPRRISPHPVLPGCLSFRIHSLPKTCRLRPCASADPSGLSSSRSSESLRMDKS